jgi:hypothetical protein
MLLARKADTGDVNSSLSRGPVPLALKTDSGAGRRGSGVASVGFWYCCGAGDRAAILGVRGGLFTALATVGCRLPATDARSYDGILVAISGRDFGSVFGFTARSAGAAFWSRSRSG